jgi:hypothetical protein
MADELEQRARRIREVVRSQGQRVQDQHGQVERQRRSVDAPLGPSGALPPRAAVERAPGGAVARPEEG